ncbi:TRAP transporter large permease [Aquisalimonas asiatica]|uniref:TRAP transporter large permease protein n=1 Tax=Aquisalimonas asiatica TaxID=406100 RepID=A0A1H8S6H7_9GAMM|nr:TRAP transporter large permease [Aquisalimonas asiatica]SEO74310.1 TRAP transporter, DctM subunit [Aquisalimonas asiatica]
MLEPVTAIIIVIPLLFILMAVGFPVFAALGISGLLGIFATEGFGYIYSTLRTLTYQETAVYLMTVIPLFILLGNFAHHAGVGRALFGISRKWVGHWPGGLAMSSVLTCAGFSATSGSSVATAATVGSIALPEMKKAGYDQRLSTGAIAAGGVLGVLIPPSVLLVFYAAINQVSAGAMLLAGVIPGILSTVIFLGGIWVLSKLKPELGKVSERTPWKERLVSLVGAWPLLVLIVVVLGGIYTGVFTPTEAAAVGALAALLMLLVSRTRGKLRSIWTSCQDALSTTVMIMMTIVGAAIFSLFLSLVQLPQMLSEFAATLPVPGLVIIFLFLLIFLPLGMFLDAFSMLVITMPIMFPTVVALGFDPIWFGILAVKMCEIGLITPPVGLNCYVIAGLDDDVKLEKVFHGSSWFVLMELAALAILFSFPLLTTWLPSTM